MNYVLLGQSESARLLLKAIGQSSHSGDSSSKLVAAGYCDALHDELLTSNPAVKLINQWEDLLSLTEVDTVIVAGAQDAVLEAARQLANDGRSIVVLPDMKTGSVFTHELSLIRDETNIRLVPAKLARATPAIGEFKQRLEQGQLGKLIQIQFARRIPRTGDSVVFSNAEIESALLVDADLLRWFGGEYNQVTAIRTGKTDDGAATATVTLAADELPEAVWTLNSGGPEWSVTAVGENGSSTLSGSGFHQAKIDVEAFDCDESELGRRWLQQIELGLSESPSAPADDRIQTNAPDWTQLTRAFEVVEATRDSIRRRRTIDLYFETTSERSLFKTQMAAMGCLVLTWTLFGMIAFLIAGSLISGNNPSSPDAVEANRQLSTFEYWLWHILRIIWLAPIVIFAFAQLLLGLAKPSSRPTEGN